MNETGFWPADERGVTSPMMQSAQRRWAEVFYGTPPWLKNGLRQTQMGSIVSGYIAALAASELKVSAGRSARGAFIDEQMQRFVMGGIRQSIQKAAALGYVALKPFVHGGGIGCEVAPPGVFWPTEMAGGAVTGGLFADVRRARGKEYVRLEEHSLGAEGVYISQKAYRAGAVRPGAEVPLGCVPAWEGLAPQAHVRGVQRPLFAVLKMPFANRVDPHSPLPVSLYADAMDSLRELDRIYSEFLWEIESGHRKQIFDITAVRQGKGCGATDLAEYKSSDQYIVLDMGSDEKPFADYTPELRVDAYQKALEVQLRVLEAQCGLSAGTLTLDGKGGAAQSKTATEVLSEDNKTYSTVKGIQEDGLRQALMDTVAVYDIYATLYHLAPAGAVEASVVFGDSVFEDTASEFARRKSLADAGYYRPELLNAWYFGVSEREAKGMMPPEAAPGGAGAPDEETAGAPVTEENHRTEMPPAAPARQRRGEWT